MRLGAGEVDPDVDHATLLALAARLARAAGALVREGRARGIDHTSSKSSATDLVTEHDRAAERLIVDELRRARPGDGLIGEEGSAADGSTGVHWLIDPIDGTTNFVYGLAGYNVSIAAATDAGTQVGAVYVPALDELFTAVRGGGARCDDAPIHCSTATDLATALVATGFSYLVERRTEQAEQVARLRHSTGRRRRPRCGARRAPARSAGPPARPARCAGRRGS